MARGRMISKSISTSRRFARLTELCPDLAEFSQTLYLLLVPHADDFGRQAGDAFTVKHVCHPASPRPIAEFDRALSLLHDAELIDRYTVQGTQVVQIVKFDDHQPGLQRRTQSTFPESPRTSLNFSEEPNTSEKPAQIHTELEEKRTKQNGREERGERALARPSLSPDGLAALWNATVTKPIAKCILPLAPGRLRRVRLRLAQHSEPTFWTSLIGRIEQSAFLHGENDRGWAASFDWLLQEDVPAKVLEGKYDNRPKRMATSTPTGKGAQNVAAMRTALEARSARHGRAIGAGGES